MIFCYNVKCRRIIAKSEKKRKWFEDVFREANLRESSFGAPTLLVCTISGVPNLHTFIVFPACLFVLSIHYSLLSFFFL